MSEVGSVAFELEESGFFLQYGRACELDWKEPSVGHYRIWLLPASHGT